MAAPRLKVVGLRELNRELKALGSEGKWSRELREAGRDTARLVEREGRSRAVVRDGDWRDSIIGRGGATRAYVAFGGARAPHGPPLEFGWPSRAGWRAQPAVYPAIAAVGDRIVGLYTAAVENILARAFPRVI